MRASLKTVAATVKAALTPRRYRVSPDGIYSLDGRFVLWQPGDAEIALEGKFTADELEAFAAAMRPSQTAPLGGAAPRRSGGPRSSAGR